MSGTLTSLIPLLACPLGMAAMMGIPAIARRARNRRHHSDTGPGRRA